MVKAPHWKHLWLDWKNSPRALKDFVTAQCSTGQAKFDKIFALTLLDELLDKTAMLLDFYLLAVCSKPSATAGPNTNEKAYWPAYSVYIHARLLAFPSLRIDLTVSFTMTVPLFITWFHSGVLVNNNDVNNSTCSRSDRVTSYDSFPQRHFSK